MYVASYHIEPMINILSEILLLLQNGETPLHIASLKGDTNAVKILARSRANVNIENNVSFNVCNTYMAII